MFAITKCKRYRRNSINSCWHIFSKYVPFLSVMSSMQNLYPNQTSGPTKNKRKMSTTTPHNNQQHLGVLNTETIFVFQINRNFRNYSKPTTHHLKSPQSQPHPPLKPKKTFLLVARSLVELLAIQVLPGTITSSLATR